MNPIEAQDFVKGMLGYPFRKSQAGQTAKQLTLAMQEAARNKLPTPILPVYAAYKDITLGVGSKVDRLSFQTTGYQGCLDVKDVSFLSKFVEAYSRQVLSNPQDSSATEAIACLRDAQKSLLQGSDVAWDFLAQKVKIDPLLTDDRSLWVTVVLDLAARCYQLNPQFGMDAAKRTQGVVYLKLPEHLEPQAVMDTLGEYFKEIEFRIGG